MSGTLRLLSDDGVSAADGLALDEALMARYGAPGGDNEETLRLYSYRNHCALVGRYQNLEAEVDLESCRAQGAEVGRRLTGGGAIVMGRGQLGVAFVGHAQEGLRPREVIAKLSGAISRGLSALGIEAEFHGKNDLEVAGRKIAGLGLYVDADGTMLFHASVLADLDIEIMLRLLKIPAAKLEGRAVAAVAERLTTVSALTGTSHDAASLRPFIARGFAETLSLDLRPSQPEPAEEQAARRLASTVYGSRAWLEERSPGAEVTGSSVLRTPAGLARLYLAVRGDLIKSVVVAGDFNEQMPQLTALESALRWTRLGAGPVRSAVGQTGAAAALGVDTDELVAAVLEAGQDGDSPAAGSRSPERALS